ncbi:helix-turn-helix domain-containing protein [Actinacidiphila acididurans]|uniref:Helix-turn-helix domain-containing protein n=1 Tax=Actinacidiphila acididurans TaxID=2784346 RepID=A0ABS2U0X0_9ACTN|nr:helix-turn-helix transcriptional regulator [Actinacidiphila acididurans]MBM9509235.1 helix-turn-helix domain-containing protein [Actinacidiphila acididurans]
MTGQGPVTELARALRELRDTSGMTLRELAQRSGYSQAALSTAEAGRTVPSWDLISAFVQTCGQDPVLWRARWEWARMGPKRGPSAAATPAGTETVSEFEPAGGGEPPAAEGRTTGGRPWRGRAPLVAAVAGGACGLALVAFVAWPSSSGVHRATAGRPSATVPVPSRTPAADGTDPYDDSCKADEKQLDWQPVAWPDGKTYGTLILMYSPTCRAAWGYLQGPESARWRTHVDAHRDPDRALAPSSYSGNQKLPGSWGNVLSTRTGCVYVTAHVDRDTRTGPTARTACIQPQPPAP